MASTTYYWDEIDDNVCCEEDENGEITASYTHEAGLYGEVIAQKRGDDVRYFNFDGEGNTCELTDENENVTDTFEYSAFGEEVARTGVTENPFGYKGALGYYTNGETGDIYVRARTYEPTIGRWISLDPFGYLDGVNRYQAVLCNPSTVADPSGLAVISIDADAFIPWKWVSVPPFPPAWQSWVLGNDRGTSATPLRDTTKSKQFNWIDIDTCLCNSMSALLNNDWGIGHSVRKDWFPFFGYRYISGIGDLDHDESARPSCAEIFAQGACKTSVSLWASGSSPPHITGMPANIDYSYSVTFYHRGDQVYWFISGNHDGFTAHQFWMRHAGTVFAQHTFVPPYPNWGSGATRLIGLQDRQHVVDGGVLTVEDTCCCR